jgi:hypothetical protein
MAYREFTDQWGTEWRAWDVMPRTVERRARRSPTAGTPTVEVERRQQAENSGEVRLRMRPGWEHGWLSFESSAEKRRLAPLPQKWEEGTDDQLREWLAKATPFPKRGSFIE